MQLLVKSYFRIINKLFGWFVQSVIDIYKNPAISLVVAVPVAILSLEVLYQLQGFYREVSHYLDGELDQEEYRSLCASAGPVFHKRLNDIEGIYLQKLRQRPEGAWWDPLWPDAGLPNEYTGEEYIRSFLSTEYAPRGKDWQPIPITPDRRGLVGLKLARDQSVTPADHPGYLYVDAPDSVSGEVMRYSLNESGELLKEKAFAPFPRYAVTFVNQLDDGYRSRAIASTTISVVDRMAGELLAELTVYTSGGSRLLRLKPERYAWSSGPWGNSIPCPNIGGAEWRAGYRTRLFVTMVLKPVGW